MRQITIQLKDAEEEYLIINILKRMEIPYFIKEENDFENIVELENDCDLTDTNESTKNHL